MLTPSIFMGIAGMNQSLYQSLLILFAVCIAYVPVTAAGQMFRGFVKRAPAPGFLPGVDIAQAKDAPHKFEAARQYLKGGKWDEAIEMYRGLMESEGDLPASVLKLPTRYDAVYERYTTVRELCQIKLAALHQTAPAALQLYRTRVDALAGKWHRQAVEQGDEHLLQRIFDQYFVSSYGDDAALLLGEYHLQRGEYAAARRCWESISITFCPPPAIRSGGLAPEATPLWRMLDSSDAKFEELWPQVQQHLQQPGRPDWLVFPDPDPAIVPQAFARLALTSIMEGSVERAEIEIKVFAKLYPTATGRLAGEDGNLLATLEKLQASSLQWERPQPTSEWTTLGGSLSRSKVMPHQSEPLDFVPAPIWKFQLHREKTAGDDTPRPWSTRVGESNDGFMSYHPVVVDVPGKGKTVFVHDRTQVYALQLQTGKPAFGAAVAGDDSDVPPHSIMQLDRSLPGDHTSARVNSLFNRVLPNPQSTVGSQRYTLTVSDGQLLARLGSPLTGSRDRFQSQDVQAMLKTFPLADSPADSRFFTIKNFKGGDEQDGQHWAFDGTPISHNGRLYVTMRQTSPTDAGANLAKVYVACFELATAKQLWLSKICGASTIGGGNADEVTHTLLSYSEGLIFINTNLGAVAAIQAGTGQLEWLMKYPRTEFPGRNGDQQRKHWHFLRDLNPCVIYKGIVVTMPADSDHIFALDSRTGKFLWELMPQEGHDASHILGVGHGNLLLGGKALYWIDIQQGRMRVNFPGGNAENPPGHVSGFPPGYGRGFLAGDYVYWPTRNAIYVFHQQTRRVASAGKHEYQIESVKRLQTSAEDFGAPEISGGNLTVVDGVLLIATPSGLYAFDEFGPRKPDTP